jgi:hypothetical protein
MTLDHMIDRDPASPLDHFLDRLATSDYLTAHGLPVAVATLAAWAVRGQGPAFHRFGRKPAYALSEINRWATEQLGQAANSTTAHDAMRSGGAV